MKNHSDMISLSTSKIQLSSIIFLLLFCLLACRRESLPVKPEPSAFAAVMENNTTDFSAAGGTANIVVSGGTNGWWVTMPANTWCVIAKIYGSGDFKIPVTIRPNTTGQAREITVTINPTFDLPPVAVKLVQGK